MSYKRDLEQEEFAKKAVELDIRNRGYFLFIVDRVKEAVKSVDGKVFNKIIKSKIEDAINTSKMREAGYIVRIQNTENRFEMYMELWDLDVRRCEDENDRYRSIPMTYDRLYFFSVYKHSDGTIKNPVINDRKRINYEAIEKLIDEQAETTGNSISKLSDALKVIDTMLETYYEEYNRAVDVNNEIPFEIREYFGLDAFSRFYDHYTW